MHGWIVHGTINSSMFGPASTEPTFNQSKGTTTLSPELKPIAVQGTPPTTADREIVDLT